MTTDTTGSVSVSKNTRVLTMPDTTYSVSARPDQDGQTPGPIHPPRGAKDWSETGLEMLFGWAIGMLCAYWALSVVLLAVALVGVTGGR